MADIYIEAKSIEISPARHSYVGVAISGASDFDLIEGTVSECDAEDILDNIGWEEVWEQLISIKGNQWVLDLLGNDTLMEHLTKNKCLDFFENYTCGEEDVDK